MATQKPKMVTIELFKDKDKYKHDLKVAVNGRVWRIQRGVKVEVPDYVAEVISASLKQDGKTADMITKKSSEAKDAENKGFI